MGRRACRAVTVFLLVAATTVGVLPGASAHHVEPDPEPSALEHDLQDLVDRWRRDTGSVGVVAAVEVPGVVKWSGASGYYDLTTREPMRPDTPMRLGSASKPLTATAIMALVEDGLLGLDDPLSRFFPDFPDAAGITIGHLLGHRSGLREMQIDDVFFILASLAEPWRTWTPDEIVAWATSPAPMLSVQEGFKLVPRTPLAPPGETWNYSQVNYFLLGMIAEQVSGKPLAEILDERVARPVGLLDTFLPATGDDPPIPGHTNIAGFLPFVLPMSGFSFNSTHSAAWAAGGIVSTPTELIAFLRGLFEARLVSPESLAAMMDAVPFEAGGASGYGLGLWHSVRTDYELFGHGGALPGFDAAIQYVPQVNAYVAFQSNTDRNTTYEGQDLDDALIDLLVAHGIDGTAPSAGDATETSSPATTASGTTAREICGADLCAGVGKRFLDPGHLDLPDLPIDPNLRFLFGGDAPPLAGFGSRFRGDIFATIVHLIWPEEYFSHIYTASEGNHDDDVLNSVKALELVDADGTSVYWVKSDLIAAFQDVRDAVIAGLHDRGLTDVTDENLLFAATHTHSGVGGINPRLLPQFITVDLFSRPIFDAVVNRTVNAVLAAHANLQPAVLGTGSAALSSITQNRRDVCECLGEAPNPDPDPELGVIRVDHPDGSPLATVFNFAIHPTSLGGDLFSPDNVGYAERAIERDSGGMALFFNGAEGDVGPRGDLVDVGETLGAAAVAARETVTASPAVDLHNTACEVDEPAIAPDSATPCPARFENAQIRPLKFLEDPTQPEPGCYLDRGVLGFSITIPKELDPPLLEREGVVFGAFRIDVTVGDTTTSTGIATLPFEPLTDVGHAVKAYGRDVAGFDHTWVFGLTNAYMGYLADPAEFDEGGYEAGATFWGRDSSTPAIANATGRLAALAPGE